jgi:hypothetical protein
MPSAQREAAERVERAPDAATAEHAARPRDGERVRRQPDERQRREDESQPEQFAEAGAELWQEAREEDRHLRVCEVAEQSLAESRGRAARPMLVPSPPHRRGERLQPEPDEVRRSGDPHGDEDRLRRGDERRHSRTRRERPERLADRDALRRVKAVAPPAEQRVPDRERGVRPRRADHYRRDEDEADHQPRTSGLYLIRCGSRASGPRVSFIHST